MDDALLVRGLEGRRDLRGVIEGGVERQGPAQGRPVHQLHDEAAGLDGVDLRDVGMVEGGKRLGFALEPGEPVGVIGKRVGQPLDRHVALERGIAGAIDLAHAALADERHHDVRTDSGTEGERHPARLFYVGCSGAPAKALDGPGPAAEDQLRNARFLAALLCFVSNGSGSR